MFLRPLATRYSRLWVVPSWPGSVSGKRVGLSLGGWSATLPKCRTGPLLKGESHVIHLEPQIRYNAYSCRICQDSDSTPSSGDLAVATSGSNWSSACLLPRSCLRTD